jgi:DNA-binding NtrC family response regulator
VSDTRQPTDTTISEPSLNASGPSDGEIGILVFGRRDARVCWLRDGDSIVIGRVPPADLVLGDRSLSRQHARLTVERDCVLVKDVGSRNGVSVHGGAVAEARLRVGDRAQLGGVTLVVQSAGAPRVASFETLLDATRSCIAGAEASPPQRLPLALLLVRSGDAHRAEVCAALRATDLAAVYGPNTLAVLLKDTSERRVTEWLATIAPRVAFALRAGVAVYPDVATRADALLAAARAALDLATAQTPVVFAGTVQPDAGDADPADDEVVAVSARSRHVLEQARRAARSELPILILGETGVGKEVLARAIHESSPRAQRPFLAVNCAALPPTLMESVLFGHERGAFTGAAQARAGLFEQADTGTLLLDEIGELSPAAQAALLRVLETKTLTRIGARNERRVDVRVLAATHRDLPALCSEGGFRDDLMHRLNAVTLVVPPLRERAEEVPIFVERFLRRSNLPADSARAIGPEALAVLCDHDWPGNVRQLKNVVERAAVLAHGNVIEIEDLPDNLRATRSSRHSVPPVETIRPAAPKPPASDVSLRERLREHEAELLRQALAQSDGSRTQAAKLLKLPLRTFMKRLKDYGIK